MDSHPVAWGLDIGHASIKAVKLSRAAGGGVTVLGYAIEPIAPAPGGDREAAVAAALEAIVGREEFGDTPVFAAISGRQVFSRAVNVPVINQKRMHQMVELEARQQIPGDFAEVEWGYHSSPAADGTSQDVALFAVKRDIIHQLIAKCKKVGLNLSGVSVPSLALYNFIRFDQAFPDGEAVIILDVGADNTDLVVYQGDQLWMRSLPVSGNDITAVFAKKFRVSLEEAETLKKQVTDSRQADKIIKVIESGLAELVSEINRSLGFYRTQNASATLDNLVISGSTFRLPGLPEYMAEKLRLTINILEDLDRIQVAPGLDRSHFMHDLQSLGVAMGLALQATGATRSDVNLMPRELRTANLLATKRWAAVAIVAMLGGAIWIDHAIASGAADSNGALAARVASYDQGNRERMKESEEVLGTVRTLAPQLARFDAIGANQGLAHAVLAGVSGAVQRIAADRAYQPPAPNPADRAPPLQGAYLNQIDLPAASAAGAAGAGGEAAQPDPFLPLAQPREVSVRVDIPAGPRQNEVRSAILAALRELPVPDHLKDLVRGRTLFSEVQANSLVDGSVDWWYLDPDRLDETGSSAPISEQQRLPTNLTTFRCVLSGSGPGVDAPAAEAAP
jgi:type IV pilus assembly protein PilM